ncbi:MAG: ATP-binding protein, partial [Chloroflexota bacterium]
MRHEQDQGEAGGGEETCPICKGTGLVHPLVESGRPDFSRVVPCECAQSALQREKLNYLEKYSNLGPLCHLTFENLSRSGRPGYESTPDGEFVRHFGDIYDAARSFADEPRGWLVLVGPTGCGKTHIACAIANRNLAKGRAVFYISAADLLDHLRATFNPASEVRYDDLFEQVKRAPLLILDDLGVQEGSPWAREKMEQLLNHRFNGQLPTVLTTDLPVEKLEPRLAGRVRDEEVCRLCVVDRASAVRRLGGLQLKLLREMSFDNFERRRLELPGEARQNLEQAYGIAVDFAESPEGWLVLAGANG